MDRLPPVSPGELLLRELMEPLGLSEAELAEQSGIPAGRIGGLLRGTQAITEDDDRRLCRRFGLTDAYWLRAQAAHDAELRAGAGGRSG
jgi:addiction module HigA family antidote